MKNFDQPKSNEEGPEKGKARIGKLADFDMAYFRELEGEHGWMALGQDFCKNQRYFTVLSHAGEKLGIVGVYDTDYEQNISHTVVDPRFRGQGLAMKFKEKLMAELGLPFLTLTIDLDNASSIRAAEKTPGIKKVSDAAYEQEFHKAKYIQEPPKEGK
ncbi:GNAT family N-acetyltransferase [Candidatus Uhrbacteria bacterium]|nr:GNAT family N-acetyltransferase [Candidatus Uhrbacteria bacterium]